MCIASYSHIRMHKNRIVLTSPAYIGLRKGKGKEDAQGAKWKKALTHVQLLTMRLETLCVPYACLTSSLSFLFLSPAATFLEGIFGLHLFNNRKQILAPKCISLCAISVTSPTQFCFSILKMTLNVIIQYCLVTASLQLPWVGRHSVSELKSNFALGLVITCIFFFDPTGVRV